MQEGLVRLCIGQREGESTRHKEESRSWLQDTSLLCFISKCLNQPPEVYTGFPGGKGQEKECTWWTISVLKLMLCSSAKFSWHIWFLRLCFSLFSFLSPSFSDIYLLDQSSNFFPCFLWFIYPLSWYFFNFPSALLLNLSFSYFIFHFQELFFVLKFFSTCMV